MTLRVKQAKARKIFQQSPARGVDPYEFIGSQSLLQNPLAGNDNERAPVVCENVAPKRRTPKTPKTPASSRKSNKQRKSPLISKMERLAFEEEEHLKRAIEESMKDLQRQQRNNRSEKRNILSPSCQPILIQAARPDQNRAAIQMRKSLSPLPVTRNRIAIDVEKPLWLSAVAKDQDCVAMEAEKPLSPSAVAGNDVAMEMDKSLSSSAVIGSHVAMETGKSLSLPVVAGNRIATEMEKSSSPSLVIGDQDCAAMRIGKSPPLSAAVTNDRRVDSDEEEDYGREEGDEITLGMATVGQAAVVMDVEVVDESQRLLVEGSPSPSMLRCRVSPVARGGPGEVAVSRTRRQCQSCDQRCADVATTTTRKRALSTSDTTSTDSIGATTPEVSETNAHLPSGPILPDGPFDQEGSVRRPRRPLAIKSPPKKVRRESFALPPSSPPSGVHAERDGIVAVRPSQMASSQMAVKDRAPAGEKGPLRQRVPVPSAMPFPHVNSGEEGHRSSGRTKAAGRSPSQRVLELLDAYAREIRQAQSSLVERIPWGLPVSVTAGKRAASQGGYLVRTRRKGTIPAAKEPQLSISYCSPRKACAETGPTETGKVAANADEKKRSLRLQAKKTKRPLPGRSPAKTVLPRSLIKDPSPSDGWDSPGRGSGSRGNDASAGYSPAQRPHLETVADSTEPAGTPNQIAGNFIMEADSLSSCLSRPTKRLKLFTARKITEPRNKTSNSTTPPRRAGSISKSQDISSSSFLIDSGDNQQLEDHVSSCVGKTKQRRQLPRVISDSDSNEDDSVFDGNSPCDPVASISAAEEEEEEEEKSGDASRQGKGAHSQVIDLTEDSVGVSLGRQRTSSPSPSLGSCDDGSSPVAAEMDTESLVECPLCLQTFPSSEVESHAAGCGLEEAGMNRRRRRSNATRSPSVPAGTDCVSTSRRGMKCSSFLRDVRRQSREGDGGSAGLNLGVPSTRPVQILPLKVTQAGRKPITPKTRKSGHRPAIPASGGDLVVIDDGNVTATEGGRCHGDGGRWRERSDDIQSTPYRTTEDGGYEVDPNSVSGSPIRGFNAISDLHDEEGREIDFYHQFANRTRAGRRRDSNRQRAPSSKSTSSYSSSKGGRQPKRLQRGRSRGAPFRHKRRGRR